MQEFFLAYARGAEAMTQAFFPFLKSASRANLEAMGFVNRRAQAHLALPSRMSRCRTPQDLFAEQARFWREASEQYAESSRKMMEIWTEAASVSAAETPARTETPAGDYIPFPHPKQSPATPRAGRAKSNGTGERPRMS